MYLLWVCFVAGAAGTRSTWFVFSVIFSKTQRLVHCKEERAKRVERGKVYIPIRPLNHITGPSLSSSAPSKCSSPSSHGGYHHHHLPSLLQEPTLHNSRHSTSSHTCLRLHFKTITPDQTLGQLHGSCSWIFLIARAVKTRSTF